MKITPSEKMFVLITLKEKIDDLKSKIRANNLVIDQPHLQSHQRLLLAKEIEIQEKDLKLGETMVEKILKEPAQR
jgi:predicted Holliday junction resolvase-like endonuclease